MTKKYCWIIVLCFIELTFLIAQPAYQIKAKIEGFQGDKAILAFRRGDKTYAKDTAEVNQKGWMSFEGNKTLPNGLYLILLPPKNTFFEFLITEQDQHFSVETDTTNLFQNLKFEDSPENQIFLDYRKTMDAQVVRSKKLTEQIEGEKSEKKKEKLQTKLDAIPESVTLYQNNFVKENEGTFAAKLVNALKDVEIPDAPEGVDAQKFNYFYLREHYWNGWDFTEEGLLLTPYFLQKIDFYMDRLHSQTPDSLKVAAGVVCEKAGVNEKMFQTALTYLVNKYYRPKVVGLDEVFVFLADNYYCGKDPVADWVSEDVQKKICEDAYMIRQVFIGNQAPKISNQLYDYETESWTEEKLALYDVDADFTVVFLWKPGCGHCKKAAEELNVFYEEFKDQGVEIYGISSANFKELDKAKKDIQLKKTTFPQTADPYLKSRALTKFYGRSLPKIYLLDKDKKIIASRIAGSQLKGIIENERSKKK